MSAARARRIKREPTTHGWTYLGLGMMATALAWWLVYYAPQGGMFGMLDTKLSCVSGDSFECATLQRFIGPSAIPAYSPLLLWTGVVVMLLGLFLTRWNKASCF